MKSFNIIRINRSFKQSIKSSTDTHPMDDHAFISEATQKICGSLDPDTVLQQCFDYLQAFMPVEIISMAVYEPENQVLRTVASYTGKTAVNGASSIQPKEIDIPPGLHKHIHSREDYCVIINDAGRDPVGRLLCEITGMKELSYITLKVDIGNNEIGNISVSSMGINVYSQEHARLLGLLKAPFSIAMTNAIRHREVVRLKNMLTEDNRYLLEELRVNSGDTIIGADNGLKYLMAALQTVAKLNSTVLLQGETGVGKEVIANAIHFNSLRNKGPFIKINCGAIPENLIDSELFGHEKGAFTGATSSKRGHFERAQNGTIFLDEIGDLPPSAQVRLLRVIQQKELIRVGGTKQIKIDVRIIVATHRNLQEMVDNGQFREDLWFRINVYPLNIPPLRERIEDIPDLIDYFIDRKLHEMNLKHQPKVSGSALKRLQSYKWPGNVRELENCVERELIRSVVDHQDNELRFEDIKESKLAKSRNPLDEIQPDNFISWEELFVGYVQNVLRYTKGKIHGKDGAAAILKINPNTLRYKLRKRGIGFGRSYKS